MCCQYCVTHTRYIQHRRLTVPRVHLVPLPKLRPLPHIEGAVCHVAAWLTSNNNELTFQFFAPNTRVLALYPQTTCLYIATVHETPTTVIAWVCFLAEMLTTRCRTAAHTVCGLRTTTTRMAAFGCRCVRYCRFPCHNHASQDVPIRFVIAQPAARK